MFISGYVNKHEKFFLRVSIVLCRVFLKCSKSSWSVKKGSASRVWCIDTKIDMTLLHWFMFLAYLPFSCSVLVLFFTKNEGQAGLGKMKLMRGYIGFQNIDWTVTESKL